MLLHAFLEKAYRGEDEQMDSFYVQYALEHMEYRGVGNGALHDNAREHVVHNGAVKRNYPLTGCEVLEKGIYSLTTHGHDGREVMVRHRTLEEAEHYRKSWCIGENPYVNACYIEVVL